MFVSSPSLVVTVDRLTIGLESQTSVADVVGVIGTSL